jgi:hypothetical protein
MLDLALLTTRRLDRPVDGALLLSRLCAHEQLVPEKCGVYDPLNVAFDRSQIDRIASELWHESGFNWKREKPKQEGMAGPESLPHVHASVHLSVWDNDLAEVLIEYLRSEAIQLGADIGYVEPDWPGKTGSSSAFFERSSPSIAQEEFDQIGRGYYTVQLKDFLVQLKWATVFGPPYVRMFGRKTLLTAPAAVVEEIAPEMIYLQLTASVGDVSADLPAFFSLRRRVKAHIGSDAFFDPVKGKGPYRVPKFSLAPWGAPRPLGFIDGKPVIGLIAGRPVVQMPEGPKILDIQWTPPKYGPLNGDQDAGS